MGWFIVGLILLVIAVGLGFVSFLAGRDGQDGYKKGFMGGAVGALVLALIFSCFSVVYTQDEGEAVVLKSVSGEIQDADVTPGFGTKAPWDKKISYSTRNNLVDLQLPFRDKDGGSGTMALSVMYNLTPTEEILNNLYGSFKSEKEIEERLIGQDVRSVLNKIPSKYSTAQILTNRGVLETEMQEALTERWDKWGFSSVQINIKDDGYSENVSAEYDNLIAERVKAETAKAKTSTAEESAKQQIVEAEAKAKANKIIADSLKSKEAMRQAELETLKSIGEKGNVIITDGSSDTLLNVDTKKK